MTSKHACCCAAATVAVEGSCCCCCWQQAQHSTSLSRWKGPEVAFAHSLAPPMLFLQVLTSEDDLRACCTPFTRTHCHPPPHPFATGPSPTHRLLQQAPAAEDSGIPAADDPTGTSNAAEQATQTVPPSSPGPSPLVSPDPDIRAAEASTQPVSTQPASTQPATAQPAATPQGAAKIDLGTRALFREYVAANCKVNSPLARDPNRKPSPDCPTISRDFCGLSEVKCATGDSITTEFVGRDGSVIAEGSNETGMIFYRTAGRKM